jgi:hypothetical protein
MSDVEKGFSDNCDDWRISDVQLLSRASVKRKSSPRPAENRFTNWTFNNKISAPENVVWPGVQLLISCQMPKRAAHWAEKSLLPILQRYRHLLISNFGG